MNPPTLAEVLNRIAIMEAICQHAYNTPTKEEFEHIQANETEETVQQLVDLFKDHHTPWLREWMTGPYWRYCTEWEKAFVQKTYRNMTWQDKVNGTWYVESLLVMVWALGIMDQMPPIDMNVDTDQIQQELEKINDIPPDQLRLRPFDEIEKARDIAEFWHWRSRTRQIVEMGQPFPDDPQLQKEGIKSFDDIVRQAARRSNCFTPIDEDFPAFGKAYRDLTAEEWATVMSITMERHKALNWLCGEAPNNKWDETPTDT